MPEASVGVSFGVGKPGPGHFRYFRQIVSLSLPRVSLCGARRGISWGNTQGGSPKVLRRLWVDSGLIPCRFWENSGLFLGRCWHLFARILVDCVDSGGVVICVSSALPRAFGVLI